MLNIEYLFCSQTLILYLQASASFCAWYQRKGAGACALCMLFAENLLAQVCIAAWHSFGLQAHFEMVKSGNADHHHPSRGRQGGGGLGGQNMPIPG